VCSACAALCNGQEKVTCKACRVDCVRLVLDFFFVQSMPTPREMEHLSFLTVYKNTFLLSRQDGPTTRVQSPRRTRRQRGGEARTSIALLAPGSREHAARGRGGRWILVHFLVRRFLTHAKISFLFSPGPKIEAGHASLGPQTSETGLLASRVVCVLGTRTYT